MSSSETTLLTCPACGEEFEVQTAASVNVTGRPWVRDQILAGQFHRYACAACHHPMVIERDFLYTDSDARLLVAVYDGTTIGDWQALERRTERTVLEVLASMHSDVEDVVLQYEVRTAFGLEGLAERVRLFEAGLDDAIVELLKLELFLGDADLKAGGGRELYVTEVLAVDDELTIRADDREGATAPIEYSASLARYRELEQARPALMEQYPSLFHRTFRSFRRLASERVVASSEG